jgi:hypothetical protein
MTRHATKRKRRTVSRDRRLERLFAERDRLLLAWQRNTAEIAGLSHFGQLLDVLVRPDRDEGLVRWRRRSE